MSTCVIDAPRYQERLLRFRRLRRATGIETALFESVTEASAKPEHRLSHEIELLFAAVHESAIGTKQTWASALQMSAFGGKADMH
jgi:hypothetical protein